MTRHQAFHPFDQDEPSLDRKLGRIGMLIHRYYEAQAHRHGAMGDPLRGQGRVLALLKAKPETTQRELSFLLDMRQQSLSELLGKLEEKGYVTRSKSPEDGRVTVVQLTEAGAEAAPSPTDMEAHTDALDCLTDEERTQLEAYADRITTSLEDKLQQMGIDPHRPPRGPHGHHRGHGGHGPHGMRSPHPYREQESDATRGYRAPWEHERGDNNPPLRQA